jgi:ABC-type Fe3+-hydroxamate transport system, periplasmic component
MQTSGAKHFGQYWLDMAGAINVAGDQDAGGVPISMEQINEWNPDILFVTNFSPYLVEDFYKNAIEGDDWSSIKAVQDEKVFKYPLGMYRWYPPSSDSPLTLLWLVKQVHPDLFKDIDLEQEIRDYYTRFYNLELTDEDIVTMMNPPREAADGV